MKNKSKTKHNYNWTGKHILIIEPNPCNCKLLEIHLRPTNCQRTFINSADEAIHLNDGLHEFDLVLIEVFLPLEVGLELIRKLKRRRPHLPILVQTVLAFEAVRRACFEAGADGFVEKPLGFEGLMGVIQKLMGW